MSFIRKKHQEDAKLQKAKKQGAEMTKKSS